MKKSRTIGDGDGPFVTAESAVMLARRAPLDAWACYLGGSIPFVLGILYFWSDMSRGAYARERCAPAALGLAFLFICMKTGQSMYAARLLDMLTHRRRPWTLRRLRRLVWVQSAVQPWGLLAIPLSMPALIPFVYVYGYFQNLTVLGDGDDSDLKSLRRRARQLAGKHLFSHSLTLWLLSPWMLGLAMVLSFGVVWLMMTIVMRHAGHDAVVVFVVGALFFVMFVWPLSPLGSVLILNLAALFVGIPELLRIFLGWDTVFRLSAGYAVANTTFLVTLFGVAYLCMDPLLKAAYVIRCFKGESLRNGLDLKVALAELREAREAAS